MSWSSGPQGKALMALRWIKYTAIVLKINNRGLNGSPLKVVYNVDESRLSSSTSSNPAGLGGSASPRLIPYDEPHPYSLSGSRDIGTVRQRTMYGDPSYSISYEERARRSSRAYEENSLRESPAPSHNTQSSYNHTLPPYASGESLPLYTRNGRSEEEIEEGIPSRSRGDFDNHYGGRQHSSSGRDR